MANDAFDNAIADKAALCAATHQKCSSCGVCIGPEPHDQPAEHEDNCPVAIESIPGPGQHVRIVKGRKYPTCKQEKP